MVNVGEIVTLRAKVRINASVPRLVLGYMIKDRLGQPIYGVNTHHLGGVQHDMQAGDRLEYSFTFPANLGPGSYSVAVALTSSDTHLGNNYEWRDLALLFTVTNTTKPIFAGCAWIEPDVSVRRQLNS
jgi:lipopolysaccharide transport system ATP-binding protein